METLGERVKSALLFDIAARTTVVGTYGSAVVDRVTFQDAVASLNSAASSAGTGTSLAVKLQHAAAAARGSFDNSAGTEVDVELRKGSNDNIKLAAKVTQSGTRQIKSVWLRLKKLGTITSGKIVTVTLESDSTGDPSGTALHADATADVETDDIAATYGWVEFELTRPVDVADTTVFHVVLTGDYTESSTNCIVWGTETVASGGDFNIYDSAWGTMSTTVAALGFDEEYTFADITGAAFTAVDETAAAYEAIDVDMRSLNRYIRALATVTGTSASFACGAQVVLGTAQIRPVAD